MKIDLNDKYEFIPEWNGNQDEAEPIKVFCKHMTAGERERCITQDIISEDDGPKVRFKQNDTAIVRTIIQRIENLIINDEPITNAAQLLKIPGVSDLVTEIAADAVLRNAREDPKN